MILPVWLSHEKSPKETLVYAILDNQSDTSFILKNTSDNLNLPSTKVNLMLSTMLAENQMIQSDKIKGLSVRGFYNNELIKLPEVYTRGIMPGNRSHIPTPEMANKWPHLQSISSKIPQIQNADIALLLGLNVRKVLEPLEVISSKSHGPFGQRSILGWGIIGTMEGTSSDLKGVSHCVVAQAPADSTEYVSKSQIVLRTKVKEIKLDDILSVLQADFNESNDTTYDKLSQEDKQFMSILKSGITQEDGHYKMPLPFKKNHPPLRSNKELTLKRLEHLKRKLRNNETFKKHYYTFMNELFEKGYAEDAPPVTDDDKQVFYIPHHGVYNINKPGKIRVVFDCSAKTPDFVSLNDCLLQGPDLTNSLLGVLCRFRIGPVAFLCDIEKMFYQFRVNAEHRDVLRFFWWKDGNLDAEPKEYRMTVHLFGASSSPGCSNFGLKQTAIDNAGEFGLEASDFLSNDFYVDDGLKSCETEDEAVNLVENSIAMCAKGGLRLHKFASNSTQVLESIPKGSKASNLTQPNILSSKDKRAEKAERALGIQWCMQSDTFKFKIVFKERPPTRRGILSTVSSVYDPLGFLAPFTLIGKNIMQDLCRDKLDWDDVVPENILNRWLQWKEDALHLNELQINRCYKPKDFGKVIKYELHHFCDASSSSGYGTCSYLRQINANNQVHVSFVMGKSRVIPLKKITVPRLELTAAVVAVNIGKFLQRELKLPNVKSFYWTDSNVVLGYIRNTSKRFHVYVANRIEQIHSHSNPDQWRHIGGKINPADLASRGMSANNLMNSSIWFNGPEFLKETTTFLPNGDLFPVDDNDPEVKKVQVLSTETEPIEPFIARFERFSSWNRLRRTIGYCFLFTKKLKYKIKLKHGQVNEKPPIMNVELIHQAENAILRSVQSHIFSKELTQIRKDPNCSIKRLPFFKLNPFIDNEGIIRVGGRLENSTFPFEVKHPIILPNNGHVSKMLVSYIHCKSHQGRGMTVSAIRESGYWIIGCRKIVNRMIHKCVVCRRYRRPLEDQKLSNLPEDRLAEVPPFTYVAVDYFGPFFIRVKRSDVARYGVLFTCMMSRAIHLEVADSLETDSFINALRRFIAIRGPIRQLRSDRGTNFVGAQNEFYSNIDHDKVNEYLQNENCDYFEFKMNVPGASHMGGVWERQIRTVRNVLRPLLNNVGSQVDDDSLRTLFYEVMAIVNSRPIAIENLDDSQQEILTPNQILTMKTKIILPPPGNFQQPDLYSRKRWRRVQHILNIFWQRWKTEYLNNMQSRQKWLDVKRNICIGDIVILKDEDSARCKWPLAIVGEVFKSKD